MRAATVQMTSTDDRDGNLAVAAGLVAEAAGAGAGLVVLPEMVACLGGRAALTAGAEPLDGPTARWASDLARAHGITLVAGTFIEAPGGGEPGVAPGGGEPGVAPGGGERRHGPDGPAGRLRNTCTVWGPGGERLAVYRKIHLFDVTVPGAEHRESSMVEPGDEIVVAPTPAGSLGLSVCYDLRFSELYRIAALGGAEVVVVPAAFTARTGPPHWEVLLRARAIENQVFVVAAGQVGTSGPGLHWHGHSMIVDPWGTVLAEGPGPEDPGAAVVAADLDLDEVDRVRGVLPSLANRRPSAYRWPT